MQHLRSATVMVIALLAAACAPQPVSREPKVTTVDSSAPADRTPTLPASDAQVFVDRPAPAIDTARPADHPVIPDAAVDAGPGVRETDASGIDPGPVVDAPVEAPAVRNALLVVGAVMPLAGNDLRLKTRLEGKGLLVKLVADSAPATSAGGMDLVVISGTSVGDVIEGKYLATTAPVLTMEPATFGPMRLTADNDVGRGDATSAQINIVAPQHPIAAGLSGTVAVATVPVDYGWGLPTANADRIALVPGMTNQFAAFAYEKGSMLVGTPAMAAPARRAGLFVHADVAERLTPAGWQIFDAAVDWTLGAP